jgi:cell division protein FtsN
MPDWLETLRDEARGIAAAPLLFAAAVLAAAAVLWGILHWSYRTVLSNKDKHIAFLERRVAAYRETLRGATPEEARHRIEALETELEMLRIQLRPRHLNSTQRQAIVDRSRLPAGAQPQPVTVVYEEDCSDCTQFAAEIADTLRVSGSWVVSTEATRKAVERPRRGLGIRVPDRLRPPPAARILQQALRSANLDYAMVEGGADSNVQLLITERVPP